MRDPVLYPLFAEIASLRGIGANYARLIEHLCGKRVLDVLYTLPHDVETRINITHPQVRYLEQRVTFPVTIIQHEPPKRQRQPYRIITQDARQFRVELLYFNVKGDWLEKLLPVGEQRLVSGQLLQQPYFSLVHPEYIAKMDQADSIPSFAPVYPLTAGLTQKLLHKFVGVALERLPDLPEWIDLGLLRQEGWPGWKQALQCLHNPRHPASHPLLQKARARLAYDEFLAHQIGFRLHRQAVVQTAPALIMEECTLQKILDILPFQLTAGQMAALQDIRADLASGQRMLRLIQGDVGSGKTILAFLASCIAIQQGGQVAIMAPTEILARQHEASLGTLAESLGITIAVLTGREKGKVRERTLAHIADGTAQLVIGTHALFQDAVIFHNLQLAVIDEQHRFGVGQRLQLTAKGQTPHLLVMTATPIPRTILLTLYSEMQVSTLKDKPPGRKPVETRVLPLERVNEVSVHLQKAIKDNAKVYWVCPLVEESEVLDLAAAEQRFVALQALFGERVGLVHGRMKGEEKDQVINAFRADSLDILVATTVIEVGVNVPSATIMVIEHAERFGLAQLHQLRGRIGRGDQAGHCLLLYAHPLSQTAAKRLSLMRETSDGFVLAEEDLKLRGAGDMLGTKQSGAANFRLADLYIHHGLLQTARSQAKLVLDQGVEHRHQLLLQLFEKDQSVPFLASG